VTTSSIDRLYRDHAPGITARLLAVFGARHLEIIDSAVQEALALALATPDDSSESREARLVATARRGVIAALGRLELPAPEAGEEPARSPAVADRERLLALLVCAHPVVPADLAMPLVLRTVCGFSLTALSRALAVELSEVIARLATARQLVRDHNIELHPGDEISVRVTSLLATLNKIFLEGYNATDGAKPADEDLCSAAIGLLDRILASPHATPESRALQAMFLLNRSRASTRLDANGDVVPLHRQDRTRWDTAMIQRGLDLLEESTRDAVLSVFHLEAAVAAVHARATTYEQTDWARIVQLYDRLLELQPSPVAALHRAIAIGRANGPREGLLALEALSGEPRLEASSALAAAAADLEAQLGEIRTARASYRRALELCMTDVERRFITKKLDELMD